MGHWEQDFSDAVWGKGRVDYIWVEDYAGEAPDMSSKPSVIQGGFDPNDPKKVAAALAAQQKAASDYYTEMYGAEAAAEYMTNYNAQVYSTGGGGSEWTKQTAALDSTQPKAKYGPGKEAAKAAKESITKVANRHDGVQSFTDQTKPNTKKDKWGWWS